MTRVLVVEDDPTLRRVIELVLEAQGYIVDQAHHGAAALETIAASRPDIVLADLKMPLMDGFALLERMRAEPSLQMIPVLLLTGNLDAARGAVGVDGILLKPFEPAELIAMIAKLTQQDAATATV